MAHSCKSASRCSLRLTTFFFLIGGVIAASKGVYFLACTNLTIFVTSYARYWVRGKKADQVDNVVVPLMTAASFMKYGVQPFSVALLTYNTVVYALWSRNNCKWHATLHLSTYVGTLFWIYREIFRAEV